MNTLSIEQIKMHIGNEESNVQNLRFAIEDMGDIDDERIIYSQFEGCGVDGMRLPLSSMSIRKALELEILRRKKRKKDLENRLKIIQSNKVRI